MTTVSKVCNLCKILSTHRTIEDKVDNGKMPSTLCLNCEGLLPDDDKLELERIWHPHSVFTARYSRRDHMTKMFKQGITIEGPNLPELALMEIFIWLATSCKTPDEFLVNVLNFLVAFAGAIPGKNFVNHLAQRHTVKYRWWHDFLMYCKFSSDFSQEIPEQLGKVCCVRLDENPHLVFLNNPNVVSSPISICACQYKTMCDAIEHDFLSRNNREYYIVNTAKAKSPVIRDIGIYSPSPVVKFANEMFDEMESWHREKFIAAQVAKIQEH